jgi:small-conductance mechanosensitive channel
VGTVSPPLVAPTPAAAPSAEVFGVHLIGFTAHTARQLLLTLVVVAAFLLLNRGLRALNWALFGKGHRAKARFWVQQAVAIASTITLVVLLISIWFENPARLTTAAGLVSAGVAVALQRVITAFAAYLVILRGKVFNVGDRIAIGGVRGDVVDLGFIRTTLLEMGLSPGEQTDGPAVWVQSRQYTGRVVTVTNDKIFEEPVYNYSSELPFLWEEMHVGVPYGCDWRRAERIVLAAAQQHGQAVRDAAREHLDELRRSYPLEASTLEPHTYLRLTDNWVDLAVRFVAPTRGTRPIKDRISREILTKFDEAGITVASTTFGIREAPPLRIERAPRRANGNRSPRSGAAEEDDARPGTPALPPVGGRDPRERPHP